MHLRRLALQHFRNVAWAELALPAAGAALVGANGQGKTNLLEAVGLLTALRSFRQGDNRLLIAHGQPEAALRFELEHERLGATAVTLRLRPEGKEVEVDGTKVVRFGDFLGRFPTVLFSSQDNQLIRGSPSARRRWLDLVLAAMDANYLDVLQRYHRALDGRNRLLKERAEAAQLAAFEQPLAAAGAAVVRARVAGVSALGARVRAAYAAIAPAQESADLVYESDVAEGDEASLAALFAGLLAAVGVILWKRLHSSVTEPLQPMRGTGRRARCAVCPVYWNTTAIRDAPSVTCVMTTRSAGPSSCLLCRSAAGWMCRITRSSHGRRRKPNRHAPNWPG